MLSWWYCLTCVAGSTENAKASLAQGHTDRTGHPTMGTTVRATWLKKMQTPAGTREGAPTDGT